ncbi:MAG: hypothetical protein Q9219_007438 [cf. Caloplaca sp. 3 TL-2023]
MAGKWLYILWLFSRSDVVTFILPNTVFGILGALSGLLTRSLSDPPTSYRILCRLPLVITFNWLNLIVFNVANQRLPEAILEDSLNKPWRPLPTKRITSAQAATLLLLTVPVVLLISYGLGVSNESALLIALTWMYNDLGGGNGDYWTRNSIIALAFAVYNAGSLIIAAGNQATITRDGFEWIVVVSTVICTTMHVQDLQDQAGDRRRRRRTVPLVLGDAVARWTVVMPLAFWAVFGPYYWRMGASGYMLSGGFATMIAIRLLRWKNPEADFTSWKLWAGWMASFYTLPLLKSMEF